MNSNPATPSPGATDSPVDDPPVDGPPADEAADFDFATVDVPGVRVGETAHGSGLFATRFFSVGGVVGVLSGSVLEDPDYHGSEYAVALNDHQTMEPDAPFRYVNHSCEPNCTFVIYELEGEGGESYFDCVKLEVLRGILPGDQLTIDYAWNAESAIPCHCGSERCRKWVCCETELVRIHDVFGPSPEGGLDPRGGE